HGMASYVAIANLYRSGRTEEAIGAVLGLARVDLAVLVGTVKAGARDIRHASPAVAAALDRLPELIMLHTEAGLSLDWKGDQDGAWQQWLDAEELAEIGPRSEAQR